jgi:hypothetical protein
MVPRLIVGAAMKVRLCQTQPRSCGLWQQIEIPMGSHKLQQM